MSAAGGKLARLDRAQTLHASAIVIGDSGILIRGPSGAGKSSLATLLLAQARLRGAQDCMKPPLSCPWSCLCHRSWTLCRRVKRVIAA